MENFIIALHAVAPMFLLIGVGFAARRLGFIGGAAAREANILCFKVFISVLLFYNIYTSQSDVAAGGSFIVFCVLGLLAEFGLGLVLILRFEPDPAARGVMLQAFFRTNMILLGLPIAESLFGAEASTPITMLISVTVPLVNALSVVALELFRGGTVRPGRIVRGIVTNPLLIGAALGLAAVRLGVHLPYVLDRTVSQLAAAATPMALVLLGTALDPGKITARSRDLILCLSERLVVSPLLAVALAAALGFRGVALTGILVTFGGPVAVNSFTMAVAMDGDADLAASLVLLSTGLSCLTLFLWIFALRTLGLL
jgi:predicted permease